MPSTWALIVGVSKYCSWSSANGADVDAQNVRDYLLQDLDVPPDNIVSLENEDATRTRIISCFKEHLIDNRRIKPGDALLFHFSGHGSRFRAPYNWPLPDEPVGNLNEEPEDELGDASGSEKPRGKLEVFLPYDEGTLGADGKKIPSIPDRTLAALLADAAHAHGRNITVVLDCCHSGHGNREDEDEVLPFSIRGVDPSRITPIREDTDKEIWGSKIAQGPQQETRGLKASLHSTSHVLIAACDKDQQAQGSPNGGLLTTYWLKALRSNDIQPRSYSEVMKRVRLDVEQLIRSTKSGFSQNPHCEGVACDRLVFQDLVPDQMLFKCYREDGECKISAGEIHGVKTGTVFDLYEVDPDTLKVGKVLGTAVASEVYSLECHVALVENVLLTDSTSSARISQQAYPLKYTFLKPQQGSLDDSELYNLIVENLKETAPDISEVVMRVEREDEADLVLKVHQEDGGGELVTLFRRDSILRNLSTVAPSLDEWEVRAADFPNLLNAISRFNFFLSQTNDNRPFSEDVSVELHVLERGFKINFLGTDPLTRARALTSVVPFEGDRFILEDTNDSYAFVLRNNGDTPLFVYMTFFDTGTYEIANCYSPIDQEKAVLPPGGTLQLGASPEYRDPFCFFIRENDTIDTCFVKFYLLDNPTQMTFMDQQPQVGCDENGDKYLQRDRDNTTEAGIRIPPQKGRWDCITRRIDIEA